MKELFEKIAQEELGISTLKKQNWDRLDFHSIGVASIESALAAAYRAGRASLYSEVEPSLMAAQVTLAHLVDDADVVGEAAERAKFIADEINQLFSKIKEKE